MQATAILLLFVSAAGARTRNCRYVDVFIAAQQYEFDLRSCTSLTLDDHDSMTPEGAPKLAEALKTTRHLTSLSLHGISLWPMGAAHIATYLRAQTTLTKLTISNVHLGYMGAVSVAEAIKANQNCSLRFIHIGDASVGEAGAVALASIPNARRKLREFHIQWSSIADKPSLVQDPTHACAGDTDIAGERCVDWAENGECLLNPGYMTRECAQICGFCRRYRKVIPSGSGITAVAEMLSTNRRLRELWLTSNAIGDTGAAELATALLKNNNLRKLSVQDMSIGDVGGAALADALHENTALQHLKLVANSIGDHGAIALAKGLKNNSGLVSLDLSINKIGDTGARHLQEAHEHHSTKSDSTFDKLHLHANPGKLILKDEL